jgi:tRNA1(Val) A37 N6-methylase TrmN6
MSGTTRDGFLDGRLVLEQPAKGHHRAGLDAILLAAAVPEGSSGHLVDLGAGVGTAGLAAAHRLPALSVTLAEIDPELAVLARANAAANGLAERVTVVEVDLMQPETARRLAGLDRGFADFALMNPPFHPAERGRSSPSEARAAAHMLAAEDLPRWVRAAASALKPDGILLAIVRADALGAWLGAVQPRFGGLDLLPIHPRAGEPAHRLIIHGRLGSRAPLRLLSGLVLHAADGGYLPDAEQLLRGGGMSIGWQ